MLQSRQGGGTYVTAVLEASFFDPWQEMMGSHPNLREDILEFRRMLEGQAAEWAAERATDADLSVLGRLSKFAGRFSRTTIPKSARQQTLPFTRLLATHRTMS
jgi:DNA-binding FadR family transcriptional regulator